MRRFLAGVFAVALGWAGLHAESAAVPADAVDWPAFLTRQDLVWPRLPGKWEEAPFIGNGNLGAFVHLEPGGPLAWEINRTDVTHGGRRYPMGHLAVRVVGGFEDSGETRLDLWNAEARGEMKTPHGSMHWRTFVAGSPSVLVIELTGLRVEPGAQVIWLPILARPPRAGSGAGDFPAEALHPPPQVRTVIDGVNSTQSFVGGGAFAVVLRRIYSSLDRKVYVLSVDRGDTAKRALSEAELSAERATSLGLDGLVAAHRSWWHRYYPASFVSLPDKRMEAFYWIQMYKLGSALRPGGPVIDAMGPWYCASPPASGAGGGIQQETGMAYSPIFTANRLTLGDSLFTADLKTAKPNQDLAQISQLAWLDYRYGMDETVLANKVVPLLARAIESPGLDPGLLRWALQTLIRIGERPKAPDPRVSRWKEKLAALAPGPSPLRSLQLLRPDRPGERKLIENALRIREGLAPPDAGPSGSPARGRGYGEAASLRAFLGQGGPALDDLKILLSRFLKPISFSAEPAPAIGVPLSAASAVQDLLLQSWGNKLRVFPAMPPAWKEASFATLRGEGGFLVSGVWRDGAVAWIRVEASTGAPAHLVVPGWTQGVIRASGRPEAAMTAGDGPGEFTLALGKGGWAILAPSTDAPLPPLGPVAEPAGMSANPYPPHPSQ